jgi:predicted nucleic acid-binding protein
MGSLIYLLDSTLVIDALNGIPQASAFLEQHPDSCAISPITRAEILVGTAPSLVTATIRMLGKFANLALGSPEADLAAEYRRLHRLKLPDALQAAAARTHKLKLVTRNSRDFPRAVFPFVEIPYIL